MANIIVGALVWGVMQSIGEIGALVRIFPPLSCPRRVFPPHHPATPHQCFANIRLMSSFLLLATFRNTLLGSWIPLWVLPWVGIVSCRVMFRSSLTERLVAVSWASCNS